METFLSIYTPTYKRPGLLQRNVDSVCAQTISEVIQHYIVRDEVGIGIGGMFAAIEENARHLTGDYVYVLQDDDVLAGPDVVAKLRAFVEAERRPPVVMVRNIKRGQIYPTRWESQPALCAVDLGSYVVREDVFRAHAGDFGRRYEGDFDFIDAVWKANWRFAWCNELFARAQALGLGRPEHELAVDVDYEKRQL